MAAALGVSQMTIRRDLDRLEADGYVRRTHGGAVLAERLVFEFGFAARRQANYAGKAAIAAAAVKLIRTNVRLILDAGTTTLELARLLPAIPDLTVITPSPAVAEREPYKESFETISASSSYGGNPMACAAALASRRDRKGAQSVKTIIDAHTHVGISARNYLTTAYPYAMSIEDLVVRMDLLGIAKAVVMPFDSSYCLSRRGRSTRSGARRLPSSFPYEKENTSLLVEINDVFNEYKSRLFPFAMFDPSRETARQAMHLRRLHRRYGLSGLKTVTTYNRSFVKDFQAEGNPIRAFALEAGLPLIFHCSWIKTDIWANVFDVLAVAEGNPELRFCLAHAARFSRKALDRAAALPNCYVDTSAFKIHCDLAVAGSAAVAPPGRRFKSDYRDPARVMRDLVLAYPGTMLWGSDTPYHYFAQPWRDATGTRRDVRLKARYDDEVRILKALPKRLVSEIAHTNTLRFLSNRRKGTSDA